MPKAVQSSLCETHVERAFGGLAMFLGGGGEERPEATKANLVWLRLLNAVVHF